MNSCSQVWILVWLNLWTFSSVLLFVCFITKTRLLSPLLPPLVPSFCHLSVFSVLPLGFCCHISLCVGPYVCMQVPMFSCLKGPLYIAMTHTLIVSETPTSRSLWLAVPPKLMVCHIGLKHEGLKSCLS